MISSFYGKQSIGFMKEIFDSKKNRLILIFSVVITLLVILSAVYAWSSVRVNIKKPLTGVLLNTGDLYFGRISYFPRLTLEDVYVIQAVLNPTSPDQQRYQVVPLKASIWSPDKIFLNYENIVYIGRVGDGSQVMQAIESQGQQIR